MTDDALWYEAAHLVGITNALNVVADAPLAALEPAEAAPEAEQVFAEIRAFYGRAVPVAMRRLGVGERGVMEVLGVTQMFSSYTKIADTLQLESDMHDLAPVDWSPAPGGPPTPHAPK